MTSPDTGWDAIVIGSGIGGLTCAAALAKANHKVLLLERHSVAGGLTQTFDRNGFVWNVGMHYLADMGPNGFARAILDWLSDGKIAFAPLGPVYDTLHFPDNFEVQFSRPEAAFKLNLKEKFPAHASEIDSVFAAFAAAVGVRKALFAGREMPAMPGKVFGKVFSLWHRAEIRKWWGRTTAEVLDELVSDPKLRAVFAAVWPDHGGMPKEASFGIQASIMRGYYSEGAYYPVGGAKAFAEKLVPVIEGGGGAVKVKAPVSKVLVENGSAIGVELDDGTRFRASHVFSDAGALNTVARLLPEQLRESDWGREILSFKPSVCHVGLYLGLEGDIRASGATLSNHWFFETWEVAKLWCDPVTEPPGFFVNFASLKNPAHDPGEKQRHTVEIITPTSWDAFSQWQDSTHRDRPEQYVALKAKIERNLLAQFERRFPALAPMVVYREVSTPLTMAECIGSVEGGIGLEVSPRRFLSDSLRARTPVSGLYLTGQDFVTPGLPGAIMGGVLAAAAIEPRIYKRLL